MVLVGGHSGVKNICDKDLQRRRMWPVQLRGFFWNPFPWAKNVQINADKF
jgi:hypothetical protein